jgi:hypothetical protein
LDISEHKIAKCYIHHENDEKNKCELTDRKLIVIKKGKRSEFAIENLTSITSNQRKLLIPIIFSGILTPLILVGFFKGFFHPLIALIFIISGVFSFYIGWMGEKALTINLLMSHRDFPVSQITEHLSSFMEYVNQYLQDESIYKRVLYLVFNKDKLQGNDLEICLSKNAHERKLYSYWQIRDLFLSGNLNEETSYILLDPLKVGSEVKYQKKPGDQGLTPVIKGTIDLKAVMKILRYGEIRAIIE